ncbi:MAG: alpha/beta fold hydrolase [Pseudomonadota bacterium]
MDDLTCEIADLSTGRATYLQAGPADADDVVLLHGGGFDNATLSWKLLLPALATSYRVTAPNWPGYGGTAPFDRPYTIADIGRWLIDFLEHLRIKRASLVGISMGGGAAIWSAINHPDRVRALVPVCTYSITDRAPHHFLSFVLTRLPLNTIGRHLILSRPSLLRWTVEAIFAEPKKVSSDLLKDVKKALSDDNAASSFTNFQRGEISPFRLQSDFSSEMQSVQHPALFIHGNADPLVPVKAAEKAVGLMQNAQLEVMNAGHWPVRETPEHFNDVVVRFLAEVHSA